MGSKTQVDDLINSSDRFPPCGSAEQLTVKHGGDGKVPGEKLKEG